MKTRNGFVSNSSSSSFIIRDKENQKKVKKIIDNHGGLDYYELDGILYTSFISDGEDIYSEVDNYISDQNDYRQGGHGGPYDEEDYVEFEGDRGFESVYIPKDIIHTSQKAKMWLEICKLDIPEVQEVLEKYDEVVRNEIEKWVCE